MSEGMDVIKSLTLHLTKSKQTCNKMDIWISKQSSYCVGSAAQDPSSLDVSGATARGGLAQQKVVLAALTLLLPPDDKKDAPIPRLSQPLRILDFLVFMINFNERDNGSIQSPLGSQPGELINHSGSGSISAA